ncbi:MAG: flagellar biosynthesis protein FlhF, partial [Turicibacter sp.]
MNIKKYRATNMSEAMESIKSELGSDAYIISSQVVRQKGLLGIFKSKQIEVTAGIEKPKPDRLGKESVGSMRKSPYSTSSIQKGLDKAKLLQLLSEQESQPLYETLKSANLSKHEQTEQFNSNELQSTNKQMNETKRYSFESFNKTSQEVIASEALEKLLTTKAEPSQLIKDEDSKVMALEQQMIQMKHMMEQLMNQKQSNGMESLSGEAISETPLSSKGETNFYQFMKQYDFNECFEAEYKTYLINSNQELNNIDELSLTRFLNHEVNRLVQINDSPLGKINIFVGPPGVGKTTTIAKIASNEILKSNKKIGFITVDTYRIGAVEQLKTYANILNVPLKVVYSIDDMNKALNELSSCDCIIIDSMGRTHREHENLEELQQLFENIADKKMFLVLSMSSKYRQLKQIINNYQVLNYDQLLLTKLDECEKNENILNVCYYSQKPLTYLCTGQEVPNDIVIATKDCMVS